MCGIVAVLGCPSDRQAPEPEWLVARLSEALATFPGPPWDQDRLAPALVAAAAEVEATDAALMGVPGVTALLAHPDLAGRVRAAVEQLDGRIEELERWADSGASGLAGAELEEFTRALVRVKDAAWAVHRDRLRTAEAVADLAGPNPSAAAVEAFLAFQIARSALDRLEVRGRDSAGLHLMITGHGLDVGALAGEPRLHDLLFTSKAVRAPFGHLSFVYKAAAEIGELGDNTRALRAAIRGDDLLHRSLEAETARCTVLGHTRVASVGIISEANSHPLDQEEEDGRDGPPVIAALNGDVDNFADLRERFSLAIPDAITTDAKVIPTLVSRHLADGMTPEEAFLRTVSSFEGSVAIAAGAAQSPDQVLLALRGSGQALYVGLAEDAFIVASEPYGLVEQASSYVRMDGEQPSPSGSRGQIVVLEGEGAGSLAGITRLAYDGSPLPVTSDDV